jgi:hypothetical protein
LLKILFISWVFVLHQNNLQIVKLITIKHRNRNTHVMGSWRPEPQNLVILTLKSLKICPVILSLQGNWGKGGNILPTWDADRQNTEWLVCPAFMIFLWGWIYYGKSFFGPIFIRYGSGSWSSILGWISIRIQIQSRSSPDPGFDDQKKLQLKKNLQNLA